MLFGFSTELYLYFVVVQNMRFLANGEIFYQLFDGFLNGFDEAVLESEFQHQLDEGKTFDIDKWRTRESPGDIRSALREVFGV